VKALLRDLVGLDIRGLWRNTRVRQLASLYMSLSLSMAVGIAVSVFNARVLGAESYGDLRFLQVMFTLVATCLTFGIFVTGSRLLAQKEHEGIEAGLMGGLFVLCGLISALVIFAVLVFSIVEDDIFGHGLGTVIRLSSPLVFVFPLQLCIDNILQGTNRIYKLSVLRVTPQALYLTTALAVSYWVHLTLMSVLLIHLATLGVVVVVLSVILRPDFTSPWQWFPLIWDENRRYGLQVYVGFLTGVASSHLGVLAVSYFLESVDVAYFALAVTLTLPLTMIPNAVGTTFFRTFARMSAIPKRVSGLTWLVSGMTLLGFVIVVRPVVEILYSFEFSATVGLAYLIAVGSVCHGLGDFYNRFVGAHGRGREIRNSNFAVGTVNVVGNLVLVYVFGVVGAAVTRILAGLTYLGMMLFSYRKTVTSPVRESRS